MMKKNVIKNELPFYHVHPLFVISAYQTDLSYPLSLVRHRFVWNQYIQN